MAVRGFVVAWEVIGGNKGLWISVFLGWAVDCIFGGILFFFFFERRFDCFKLLEKEEEEEFAFEGFRAAIDFIFFP